jgi:trans-aconitate methyltransferase
MEAATWCGVAVLGVAVLSVVYYTLKTGISPLPSSRGARHLMLAEIPEDFAGRIVEAGAGWGTLAIPLARRHPAATVTAYELSPVPFAVLWLRRLGRHPNLRPRRADFRRASLADADIVVCYLFPGAMRGLADQFRRQLRPGTRVISNTFALPGWSPVRVHRLADLYASRVYIYEIAEIHQHRTRS